MVGFHAGGGKVNKISSVNHNFPPHVVQAAQVGTISFHTCYFQRGYSWLVIVDRGRSDTYTFLHVDELTDYTSSTSEVCVRAHYRQTT